MHAAAKVVRKLALIGIVDEEPVADPSGKSDGCDKGGGHDTVESSVSFMLGNNLEGLE